MLVVVQALFLLGILLVHGLQEKEKGGLSFVIFLTITAVIVTPAIFALSFHSLVILEGINEKVKDADSMALFAFDLPAITAENFRVLSVLALMVINFFASVMVAMIRKWEIKSLVGIPAMMFSGYFMYQILMLAGSAVFGGLGAG